MPHEQNRQEEKNEKHKKQSLDSSKDNTQTRQGIDANRAIFNEMGSIYKPQNSK